MNLCPCGARGDPAAQCACTPQRIHRYREKLSRALLDRFDLALDRSAGRGEELAGAPGESSELVRARVVAARERLRSRAPTLTGEADRLLTRAVERLPLSGRGRSRVARVAVTIAALAGAEGVAARAPGRGALVPPAPGADGVSALAAAVFAAETGSHLVDEPRSRRFAAFSRSFDEAAYLGRLAAAGLAWLSRDDPRSHRG